MPDEKVKSTAAAKEEPADAKQGEEEATYPAERLILESDDRFGVPSYVAAGAFEGAKKNLTIDEGKKLIKDFGKQEVEVDNPVTAEQPGYEAEEVEA